MNRVKELLTETELSLNEIAERTGFKHVEYLSAAFKKENGTVAKPLSLSMENPRVQKTRFPKR